MRKRNMGDNIRLGPFCKVVTFGSGQTVWKMLHRHCYSDFTVR